MKISTVATLFFSALVVNACPMVDKSDEALTDEYNDFSYNVGDIVDNDALCLSQGEGDYTFGMLVQAGSLGIPGSTTGGYLFAVMDNACKLLGLYVGDQQHCGVPFVLEANYLKYVLTVDTVDTGIGDPYFSFYYANGKYSIRNNGCVCNTISNNGNGAVSGCRCAFPVDGEPAKRELEFTA